MSSDDNVSMQEGDVIFEDEKYDLHQLLEEDTPIIYAPYKEYMKKKTLQNKDMNNFSHHISKTEDSAISDNNNSNMILPSNMENVATEILPRKIIYNTLQACEVINIVNPNEFYILREVDHPSIEKIIKLIDACSKTANVCLEPEIGEIYLGKFTDDDNWYRAKVLSSADNEKYCVYYMDYSNKEEIDKSRLRECPKELKEIPEFAVRCSLHDITPAAGVDWCKEAIDAFSEMVLHSGKTEIMSYTSEEIESSYVCHVELRRTISASNVKNESSFSVKKALTFMGHARFRGQPFICEEPGLHINRYDRCYSMPNISSQSVITVKPGKVHTPWSFYLYSESEMKMYEVESNSLQEYCREYNIPNNVEWMIFYPITGMVCIVKVDDVWYRALVKKVLGNGILEVLCVDTGYENKVSYKAVRKLPDSFSRIPVQAIKCSLADICPMGKKHEEEWTEEAIQFFIKWLNDNKHQLKANLYKKKDDIFEVDLTVFNGKRVINIAHLLVDKNYAITVIEKFSPQITGYIDLDPNEEKSYASMNKSSMFVTDRRDVYIKPPVMKPARNNFANAQVSKRVEVQYLGLKSPDCIFIKFLSQQVFFKNLERLLTQEWPNLRKVDISDVIIGGVFAVEYKKNKYARVKVLQIEERQCMTQLIDVGGLKAYSIDQLHLLTANLLKTKGFAAIVKLANIIPPCGVKTWPNTSIDMLDEVLKEKEDPFIIKCASAYKNPSLYNLKILPVQLGWVEVTCMGAFHPDVVTYPHVNELLINSGLALPIRCDSSAVSPEMQTESVSEVSSLEQCDLPEEIKPETRISMFNAPDKPTISWPPLEPLTETTYQAVISNVDNECNIYFHLVEHNSLLKQMGLTYEYKFSRSQQTNNDLSWSVSSPIVAQYHADGDWYRAVVQMVNDESIHVLFVDYGNKDDICITKIRATDGLYMKTPILCYKGQLSEIVPLTEAWHVKTLDFIHHIIVEQQVTINLLEPYSPNSTIKMRVELMDTKQDLASFLVSIGNICKYAETIPRNEIQQEQDTITEVDDITDEGINDFSRMSLETREIPSSPPEPEMSVEESFDLTEEQVFVEEPLVKTYFLDFILPKMKFPTEEAFPVSIPTILNARNLFIIPCVDENTTDFNSELNQIKHKLSAIMKSASQNPCDQVMVSDYSQNIYIYRDNGELKRICILGDYEDKLKIRLLDYGHEILIDKTELKKMPTTAYSIPPLAMPIYLVDLESQALRSLFYKNTHDSIIDMVYSLETTIYASVMESRQIPKMKLFIVKNGKRCNLFEYLTK